LYNQKQINSVSKVLKNNKTNYWTGDECSKFEKEFSSYHNTTYSIAVSNGSVALEIALKALCLKKNDEVIVSPRSFVISASCVLNLGLKPVFSDVDHNGNLNIDGISKVYNSKTKAIILVHLNGMPCDLDPIISFVKKKKLYLIEDCSQAHGAEYKKKKVGTFGDIATWSFCQDKIISTGGEGGMISTNKKELWQNCWSIKDHGKNYKKIYKKKKVNRFLWLHDYMGSNYRLTEMQAAIGRHQLRSLNSQIKKRNLIANLYINELKYFWKNKNLFKKPEFKCSTCPIKFSVKKNKCNDCKHVFYRLNFFLYSKKNQKKIINLLSKKNIQCGVGSCPEIYREKIFKKLKFGPSRRLPRAKSLGEESVTFKINPFKSLNVIKKEIILIKNILFKFV
jgi:dTDP-4-amino-4,6-dideoxygalactose transaminase